MARRGPKGAVAGKEKVKGKGVPSCPEWLDAEAKREWRRVLLQLVELHGIGCVDRGALIIYCKAYSDVMRLERYLKKHGETYETNTGNPRIRPEVEIMNKAAGRMLQAMAALGMTPVSRKNMAKGEAVIKDPTAELLNRRAKARAGR